MKLFIVCATLSIFFGTVAASIDDLGTNKLRTNKAEEESLLEEVREDLLEEEEALLESILERDSDGGTSFRCTTDRGDDSKTFRGENNVYDIDLRSRCFDFCNTNYIGLEKRNSNRDMKCSCFGKHVNVRCEEGFTRVFKRDNDNDNPTRRPTRSPTRRPTRTPRTPTRRPTREPEVDPPTRRPTREPTRQSFNDDDDDDNDYLGCYEDGANSRNLSKKVNTQGFLTVSKCIEKCEDKYYDFAGIAKSGGECWCGDRNNNRKANARDCELIKSRGGRVGGSTVISVYRLQIWS